MPDLRRQRSLGAEGAVREIGMIASINPGLETLTNFCLEIERCLCGERIIMSVCKHELSERWKKGKGKTRSQGRPRVSRGLGDGGKD